MKKNRGNAKQNISNIEEDVDNKEVNSLWNDPFVCISIIILLAFVSYFNTINVPFTFDDYPYLADNPAIRSFQYFLNPDQIFKLVIDNDVKNNFILRPVSYFTFAINYAIHGYDVRGYHIVNLLIHIGNAILVFFLVSLTQKTPGMETTESDRICSISQATLFPLISALIFVVHPLQTQAVTYTIQRFTSLLSLFFLASLVFYIASRLHQESVFVRRVYYLLAVVAAILAMNTKENAFMLPVVLVIYEFIFFKGNVANRAVRLVPIVATMVIIPYRLLHLSSFAQNDVKAGVVAAANIANFKGASSWDYLMTQFGVIVTYLRLLIAPFGQNFLYDLPLQKNFFTLQVIMPLVLLLLVISIGIWALKCSMQNKTTSAHLKIVSFGIFWFFVTLAVESTIIPLDDLIFEHRAYLPSVGFFMAIIAGADAVLIKVAKKSLFVSRISVSILSVMIIMCVYSTVVRNRVWQDHITFWTDIVLKSPKSSRAHDGLGGALANQAAEDDSMALEYYSDSIFKPSDDHSQIESAIKEFRLAIMLNPDNKRAKINLGVALIDLGKFDEAIIALQQASIMKTRRFLSIPYLHIGRAFEGKGDLNKAKEAYLTAIMMDPLKPRAYRHLGDIYLKERNYIEAAKAFQNAYNLAPDDSLQQKIDNVKKMMVK